MKAGDPWTESLACSNCGLSGSVLLSQPKNRAFDFSVEAISAGFKTVRSEFGQVFYCKACNRPAETK